MDENDEKVEVQLEEPKIEEPVIIDDVEDEIAAKGDGDEAASPENAIEELKKKLEEEQKARKEAQRLAREAQTHVAKAYTEVDDTNKQLVHTAIENLERDMDVMTTSYAEAMSAGEYERAAKIQRAMTANETKLEQLKYGYAEMQKAPPQRSLPEAPPPSHQETLSQIIDSVTPESARWLEANKSHIRDQNDIQDMFNAHNSAVSRGISPDTPQYFAFIERRLGIESQQEEESVMSSASKPTARKAAPPAAPVNRTSSSKNSATLTKAEAEMAQALGMSHKEYWTHQQALKKEGKLSH
jgi:predicted translin family RNA/ssDNA-binding protein